MSPCRAEAGKHKHGLRRQGVVSCTVKNLSRNLYIRGIPLTPRVSHAKLSRAAHFAYLIAPYATDHCTYDTT